MRLLKRQYMDRNREPYLQAVPSDPKALRLRLCKQLSPNPSSIFQLEVEFTVAPGITVIVGHSGAGKTTILRCIGGLCDPEEGQVAIGDHLLFDSLRRINIDSARRGVGFVFQDLALFPHLSVEDNVKYGLRRLNTEERKRRMSEVLQAFQIEHLCKRFPRQISGGEQQRVALARSLVTEPSVLLLDEPLSSLDPRTKGNIIEDLRSWNAARQIPIVYVTHDYEEVLALGDRVIALDQGLIIAEGLPQEIVPELRRQQMAQPTNFENLFDATVIDLRQHDHTMVCQITGTSIHIEAPLSPLPLGSEVRIGIRADEIMIAASQPAIINQCCVLKGRVKGIDRIGSTVEVRLSCGADFRAHLTSRSLESFELGVSTEVWMIIRPHACHLVRPALSRTLKRLFVFVCSANTSRSPMAQAICNAEIASRLGVPLESLDRVGIKAVSAGLKARPGEPLAAEAERALATIGIPGVQHRSGNLTLGLVQKAEVIFCMTEEQRHKLIALFPEAASKAHCLNPLGDIYDPSAKGDPAFLELANLLEHLIGDRLSALGIMEAA